MNSFSIEVQPLAVDVVCSSDSLQVELADGREITVPLDWYPKLLDATPKDRNNWTLIGGGLVLCGGLITLGIGHSFEALEPEEAEAAPGLARHLGGAGWLAAFLPPVLLIAYMLVVDALGFLIAAAILLLVASRALGASWRLAIGVMLAAPPVVHAVFAKLLRVPLPDGLLAAPW